ncbi:phage antirepressor protein [archaeon]|nr:phage antirepressor protein [archaeon]
MSQNKSLVVFESKNIRRVWHNDEWYYSVVDVVGVLSESSNHRRYWSDLKIKLKEEGFELYGFLVQLKLLSSDSKKYLTDCASTKSIFRIIQSIPSKKAEPFKLWLAQLGKERIEEIQDPELAQNRVKEYYEMKGYPKDWIDKRLRGIAVRQELTDEWGNRGVQEGKEFAILTNEISKATFGVEIKKHKEIKNIPTKSKANLRDNMTDLELIFNMLGEKATTEIHKTHDSKKFGKLKEDSKKGGKIAGNA